MYNKKLMALVDIHTYILQKSYLRAILQKSLFRATDIVLGLQAVSLLTTHNLNWPFHYLSFSLVKM